MEARARNGVVFVDVVDALYDAALDPSDLQGCLRLLADAVGGVAPGLSVGRGPHDADLWSLDVPERRLEEWREHFSAPLFQVAERNRLQGTFLASDLMDLPAWNEFLEAWARPQGFEDLVQGQLLVDGRLYGLGIFRERGTPDFDRRQVALVDRLMPHIARALQLRERMGALTAAHDAASAALEGLAIGLVLLDHRARILEANDAARSVLSAGDGLGVRGAELVARDARAHAALGRLLGALVRDALHPGGSLSIPRPSGRHPYGVVGLRLPRNRVETGGRAASAALFVSDPEESVRLCEARVGELHGLTPAQARVACCLARGQSPEEIAAELELTVQTVRSHLKGIFARTGTSRQSELVSLVLGSLGGLRSP